MSPDCSIKNCTEVGERDYDTNGPTIIWLCSRHQVRGIDLAAPDNDSDTAQANPPLSAPTNTDEVYRLTKELLIQFHGDPNLTAYEKALARDFADDIARLIALKQREELEVTMEAWNDNTNSGLLKYASGRYNELNKIIGSEK